MEFNYILFDLDGTLTDSALGITNSIMYALKQFGIFIKDPSVLNDLVGPPLLDAFLNRFKLSEQDANRAIGYYREYYSDRGIFENVVYAGIPELLFKLKNEEKKIILATTKPIYYAEKILAYFDLMKYFDFVAGSNLDGSRQDKGEVIQYAIDQMHIMEKQKVVMVGDRKHDIIGAKKCDIKSIGVLYGYGYKRELKEAGSDIIVETVAQLEGVLVRQSISNLVRSILYRNRK